jgi:hypothetical protein
MLGRRRVLTAIIIVLVAAVATESIVLAATARQGTVRYIKTVTESGTASTNTTAWTDVPSTALAMTVPSGEHDFFQVTFSAGDPSCFEDNPNAGYAICKVRALVDGQPIAPGEAVFGTSESTVAGQAASMQWVSNVLAPGTHYVKMQFRVTNLGNTMSLFERTMTIIRARAT